MPKRDPRDKWTIHHFSQANPRGPGQGGVAALLRRVADTLDELGEVQVEDLTFSKEITEGEDWVSMTVYYHRDVRRQEEHA
jgi:hypothetical protein